MFMNKFFNNLPLSISGIMLAILSLGNIFEKFKYIFLALGFIILLLLIFKLIFSFNSFKSELDTVIGLSSFGTFSMSLMSISAYFAPFTQSSVLLWYLAILIHIVIIICFTKKYLFDSFNIEDVHASWWIVYIGLTMASITSPAHSFSEYAYIFFNFTFALMIPTLILISYRYFKFPLKEDSAKPLICIYTALFSILLVGYVSSYEIDKVFITVIYIIAIIFYIFSFYNFVINQKIEFYPTFAAFTFPFVISAIATKDVYNVFQLDFLGFISTFENLIALILVIYISSLFFKHYFTSITK
ncbi:SLAC1 family transporter [Methanobrevibacter oralis]|nr:hypothetical protein [Methanobrevibacter oralis]